MPNGNSDQPPQRSAKDTGMVKRVFLAAVGAVATVIGIAGIWLPGLPTTPFILLALWCFARSSDRLSAWMRRTPLLRTAIHEADLYARDRNLPMSVKIVAQSMAWGSTIFTWLVSGKLWLTLIVGALAVSCSIFAALTPTRRDVATN